MQLGTIRDGLGDVLGAPPAALREQTGEANLEDAFVKIIGSGEGLAA